MPKVVMGFEPQEARLIQAFLKINNQFDKTKDKAKQLNQQTKQGQSAFSEMGGSITSQLGSMAAGFLSISTVISEVTKAWQSWNDQIDKTGNALSDFTNQLKAVTTGRGDPYSVVRPELIDIAKSAGLNRQEIIDLYGAVGNALPFGASTQQILSLTREVAGAKRSIGGEDLSLLGTIAGVISKTAMQPGQFTEEAISNVAFSALQNLGERAPKATRPGFQKGLGALGQMGISGPEAVSMMVAAQFAGESGGLFERMAEMAEKRELFDLPAAKRGEIESPQMRARRAMRAKHKTMAPEDFIRDVLGDEAAMKEYFPGRSFKIKDFAEAYDKLGPALTEAMEKDAIDAQWASLKNIPEVKRAWELEQTRAGMSLAPLTGGPGAMIAEGRNIFLAKEEARLEYLVQQGQMQPYMKDFMMQGIRKGVAGGLYENEIYAILGLEPPVPIENPGLERVRREAEETGSPASLVGYGYAARGAQEVARVTNNTAENFRQMNNEFDKAKDEAKAVDVGDRE